MVGKLICIPSDACAYSTTADKWMPLSSKEFTFDNWGWIDDQSIMMILAEGPRDTWHGYIAIELCGKSVGRIIQMWIDPLRTRAYTRE